jgi:predicted small lipoprotein YifL
MKRIVSATLSILLVLSLSACGSGEPELSAEDIRNTAIPVAMTSLAQTQMAMPTATQPAIPPTGTLSPTPFLTNTLALIATATSFPTFAQGPAAGTTPTLNPCYDVPPVKPRGTLVQIKLVNYSRGLVDLNLGMENPNPQGECATYYFRLGRYDQQVVSVLAACYWGYAYITDPTSNAQTIAPLCLYDTTKTIPVAIGTEVIELD